MDACETASKASKATERISVRMIGSFRQMSVEAVARVYAQGGCSQNLRAALQQFIECVYYTL